MRNRYLLMSILALMCGAALASSALAAETAAPAQVEHEGVPLKAAPLVQIGKFAITNSMLVTWIVAAGIIIFAQIATRTIKPIPSGIQNFWEWLVESLYNFLENIIGRELVRKTFWFFATIFIFILFVNWFGLIPGVGTIGWGHYDPSGVFHIDRPLLRGGNADLGRKLAMHIAAANPQWIDRDSVPADAVTAEREIYANSDEVQSKPEQAREKIVEGMLGKRFFGANVLLDQEWVHDSSKTVAQALKEAGAEVVDFARLTVSG